MPVLTAPVWDTICREKYGHLPGRNELPGILMDAYLEGRLGDLDTLAVGLEDAWTAAEFPLLILDAADWFMMFDEVGFLDNGARCACPKTVPALWRAAVGEHPEGMSWTDDRERANWFYDRNVSFGLTARLLRLDDIHLGSVLAHFHGEGTRNESEWVLESEQCTRAFEVTR